MSSSQNTCWIVGGGGFGREIGSESCHALEFTFTVLFITERLSKTGSGLERPPVGHPAMANSWTLFESSRNTLSATPSRSSHKPLANYQSAEIGRMTLLFRLRTPRRGLHPNVRSSGTPQHRLYQWQNAKQTPRTWPTKINT